MAIVSYRIYCDDCTRDEVIRKDFVDESPWKVNSFHQHSGVCPDCNPKIDASSAEFDDNKLEVPFTELKGIGSGTASNLHDAGIETRGDVREASDEELRNISGVGATSLESIRAAV